MKKKPSISGKRQPEAGLSRRDALRYLALGGAAGALAPRVLAAQGIAHEPPLVPTGRIVVGISQEPTVFNPLMAHIEVDDGVHFSLFDALFRIDPDGTILPNLAAEVPTQQNGGISEDGLSWRIRLRDDVTWHDGRPFTAEDVEVHDRLDHAPGLSAPGAPPGTRWCRDITGGLPDGRLTWRMEKAFAHRISRF